MGSKNECVDFLCKIPIYDKINKFCIKNYKDMDDLKDGIKRKKCIPIFTILKYPIVKHIINENTNDINSENMTILKNIFKKYGFNVIAYSTPMILNISFWKEHYINSLNRKESLRKNFIEQLLLHDLSQTQNIIMLISYEKKNESVEVLKDIKKSIRKDIFNKFKIIFKKNESINDLLKDDTNSEYVIKYYNKHIIHFSDNIFEIKREIKNFIDYVFYKSNENINIEDGCRLHIVYYFKYILNLLEKYI